MSTDADIVTIYTQLIAGTYAICASNAWIAYEYFAMFKYEVDVLWKRKWSAATWIFVGSRYLLVAKAILQTVPIGPQLCHNNFAMNFIVFLFDATLPTLPSAAFSILRCFALMRHSLFWPIVLWTQVLLNLFVLVANSIIAFGATWIYSDDPVLGPQCATSPSILSTETYERLQLAVSSAAVAIDAVPLAVILVNTLHQVIRAYYHRLPVSLSQVLLRDCSIYFLVSLILSAVEFSPVLNGNGPAIYALAPFFDAVPLILLARFVINLRQAEKVNNFTTTQGVSRVSALNFRMITIDDVVGNLGEELDLTTEVSADYEETVDGSANEGEQATPPEIDDITRGNDRSVELSGTDRNNQILA